MLNGHPVTFIYHLGSGEQNVHINGELVNTEVVSNRYRTGGLYIDEIDLVQHLNEESNKIEINL